LFHVFDGIGGFDFESDGFSSKCFDKDLHNGGYRNDW
jgi:hypothetical protein